MPTPTPRPPRRLPEAVRRRLEVATAMGWEALIEAHSAHALQFVALLSERLTFDEAVDRYLGEMGAGQALSTAVRTRVLVALEDAERDGPAEPKAGAPEEDEDASGWRRFRPDVVMRGVRDRVRRNEETEGWIQLAIARAEEGILRTHVDNAITFVALLDEHMALDRAVEEYIDTMKLSGGRAQAVLQRTMARLADVHLPAPPPNIVRRPQAAPSSSRRSGTPDARRGRARGEG